MQKTRETQAFCQAVRALPLRLQQVALTLSEAEQGRVEELRLRTGWPMTALLPEGERALGGAPVESRELEQLLEIASQASIHTVLDQVRRGYLTIQGGHRIGLCGTAAMEGGQIHALRALSSASIRIARQKKGVCAPVLDGLCPEGRLADTLILSPPEWGRPPCSGTSFGRCPGERGAVPSGCLWRTSGARWPRSFGEYLSWKWVPAPMWWRAAPRHRGLCCFCAP